MMTELKTDQELIKVFIVDDHPAICEGLGYRISAQSDMAVCGNAAAVEDALQQILRLQPDVVIVDIALKHSSGIDLIKAIRETWPEIRPLVLSMYEESLYADRCLRAGAFGYVNKEADADEVVRAIRHVSRGQAFLSAAMTSEILSRAEDDLPHEKDPMERLTNRQMEVFRLIGSGLSLQQIAERLHISIHTVETHREHIKHKLKAKSLSELTCRAVLWTSNRQID
ncbi:response regulator [bacterium]|nr:response regulator [bacterium]